MSMKIVKLKWWQKLFCKAHEINWIPPKLSEESLESLAIAVIQIKDYRGLAMNLPAEWVLQPWVVKQFPLPPWCKQ